MKRLAFLVLITAIAVLTGCSDAGISVPDATNVDAATEAKMNGATSEVLDVAGTALSSAMSNMSAGGTGTDGRTVTTMTVPQTTVETGVTVSGNGSYNDVSGDLELTLNIVFSNYTDGTNSLDGKISYLYDGTFGESSFNFSATVKGDVEATINGEIYALTFSITLTFDSSGNMTVNGWVKSGDGFVVYKDTVTL